MIYYASSKRDRDRMARAMLAFTSYNPSIFRDGKHWRVQDDSIGNDWGSLIKCHLDAGFRADRATPENVAKHRDHSEIPTAHS